MEGGYARHGSYDADGGKHPQYSFAQCELLTTSGFPAVGMDELAAIHQESVADALSEEFASFG